MKPGKELNKLVAKEIMGLTMHDDYDTAWRDASEPHHPFVPLGDYSGSMRDAWQVVEKLSPQFKFHLVSLTLKNGRHGFGAQFGGPEFQAVAEKASLAICLAGLKAIRSKTP